MRAARCTRAVREGPCARGAAAGRIKDLRPQDGLSKARVDRYLDGTQPRAAVQETPVIDVARHGHAHVVMP